MGRWLRAKRRLLERLAHFVVLRPGWILAGGAILTAAGAWFTRGLEFRSDLGDFLPESSPVVRSFRETVEHFGTSDHLLVVLQGGGEEDADPREVLAECLAEALSATGRIEYLDYRMDAEALDSLRQSLLPYALLYLEEESLPGLERKLSDAGIREQVRENRRLLLSPASPFTKQLVQQDPLGIRTLFEPLLAERGGNLRLRLRDGYLFSSDLRLLLLIAKPKRPAQDVAFTRDLLREFERIEAGCRGELAAEGEDPAGVRIGVTGGYAFVVENEAILKSDMLWNLVTAAVGVTLLFWLAFRSAATVLYVGLPLVAGLAWTAGFAGLAVGNLNLFTAMTLTILIGLEVDFTIHLLTRYREERGRGLEVEPALVETVRHTGLAILTAADTTIAAFYAALTAQFRGLVQLGLICGTGMILCLVANLLLIPAAIVIASRWNLEPMGEREPRKFGLEGLARAVVRHPGRVIALGGAVTLVLGWFALGARVETSFRDLKPADSPAALLQAEVVAGVGSPLVFTMVLSRGGTEEEVLAGTEGIVRRLQPLVQDGTLVFVNSLRDLIPPFADQRRNLDWLARRRREDAARFDPGRILGTLREALRAEGFREDEEILGRTAEFLDSALNVTGPLGIEPLLATPLGPRVSRFVRRSEAAWEVLTYAYPGAGLEVSEVNRRIRAALQEGEPAAAEIVGVGVLGNEIQRLLRRDGVVVTGIAAVAVLFLMYIDFRRWRYVFLAGLPCAIGLIWTVGIMEIAGLPFNLVNFGILPILIGIGVDSGIHLVHRFLAGSGEVVRIFHNVGRAILMTTLTTMVGFGTLVFANFPALVTAGWVALIGLACCLLTSVTILPALLCRSRR
ncbi:MAG: MMPL family transporter [Acidobacteria bacterium]|nr:MMPL family transporter [Acidobacteriota bacterium]